MEITIYRTQYSLCIVDLKQKFGVLDLCHNKWY